MLNRIILAKATTLLAALTLFGCTVPAEAQVDGSYRATHDGVETILQLERVDSAVHGQLTEGELNLRVQGVYQDGHLQLALHEPLFQIVIGQMNGPLVSGRFDATLTVTNPFTGASEEQQLSLERDGIASVAPAPSVATTAPATRDPQLVGSWMHEDIITSPGGVGFASFSTRRTMQLTADGRIWQWVESAGGGADWSHSGGRTMEFEGEWRSANGQLQLRETGSAEFDKAILYRFSGNYLVLEGGGERFVLQPL